MNFVKSDMRYAYSKRDTHASLFLVYVVVVLHNANDKNWNFSHSLLDLKKKLVQIQGSRVLAHFTKIEFMVAQIGNFGGYSFSVIRKEKPGVELHWTNNFNELRTEQEIMNKKWGFTNNYNLNLPKIN